MNDQNTHSSSSTESPTTSLTSRPQPTPSTLLPYSPTTLLPYFPTSLLPTALSTSTHRNVQFHLQAQEQRKPPSPLSTPARPPSFDLRDPASTPTQPHPRPPRPAYKHTSKQASKQASEHTCTVSTFLDPHATQLRNAARSLLPSVLTVRRTGIPKPQC